MVSDNDIKNIIHSDDNIEALIKKAPQSYNSILGHLKDNGTMQQILRRRIKRLFKQSKLWKMRVPGTRFGLILFCTPEHDYKIFVYNNNIGGKTRIFYMYDYVDTPKEFIFNNFWELKGNHWNKWEFFSDTIKFSKISLREGSIRLWE